jgi:hypothetical protein
MTALFFVLVAAQSDLPFLCKKQIMNLRLGKTKIACPHSFPLCEL